MSTKLGHYAELLGLIKQRIRQGPVLQQAVAKLEPADNEPDIKVPQPVAKLPAGDSSKNLQRLVAVNLAGKRERKGANHD